MDELTVYGWHKVWQIIAFVTLPAGLAYLVLWHSLLHERSQPIRHLAVLAYTLLFVAGGGFTLLLVNTLVNGGRDRIDESPALMCAVILFGLAIFMARRYFRCTWPAACWLAVWVTLFSCWGCAGIT